MSDAMRLLSLLALVLVFTTPMDAYAQATQDPEAAGGELDRRVPSGAPYGSRDAIRRSETEIMRRIGAVDASDRTLPIAMLLFVGVGGVMPSSYAGALRAHAFGANSPNIAVDAALTYRLSENFFLGGQIGGRGHGWLRRDGNAAMVMGLDAMAILHLRFQLGSVIDLGAMVGVGGGLVGVQLYDATTLAGALRLSGSILLGARVTAGCRIFLKGTWDYFNASDIDRFGSDIELGGPMLSLGIEVRS